MIITLTEEQIKFAKDLGYKRSASMNHANTKNSINPYKDKPNWWRHYIGALGEVAYSILTNQTVDDYTFGKGDKGYDFDDGVDIKASDLKTKPNLLVSFSAFKRKQCKRYVLVWVKLPQVEFLGTINKSEVPNKARIIDSKYGLSYFVSNTHLKAL